MICLRLFTYLRTICLFQVTWDSRAHLFTAIQLREFTEIHDVGAGRESGARGPAVVQTPALGNHSKVNEGSFS